MTAAGGPATGGSPGSNSAELAGLPRRLEQLDWRHAMGALDREGYAILPAVLEPDQAAGLRALYAEEARFRTRVVMERHNFGRGEYRYFAYPLPPLVQALREVLYPPLARVANRWAEELKDPAHFPPSHAEFLAQCHAAGQLRPTPLLLRYGPGDYNCLHQDLYGAIHFPLQVIFLLNAPGSDFAGGELLVVEQRPRRQSRAQVVPLRAGDAAVIAVRYRPVEGRRGSYRANMRHGVSAVREGERFTLGIIFHDAA